MSANSSSKTGLIPYKYRPLKAASPEDDTFEIRVINLDSSNLCGSVDSENLRCKIEHVVVDPEEQGPCRSYSALSYTWGDQAPIETLECEQNMSLQITPNLRDALMALAEEGVTSIWADAVCIDQSNPIERTQQVQIMGSIFSQATQVETWLGPDTSDSEGYYTFDAMEGLADGVKTNLDVEAWASFLSRPYFSRRWIIQELALAQRVRLYCGSSVIDGEKFFQALASVFLHGKGYQFFESTRRVARAFLTMRPPANHDSILNDSPLGFVGFFSNFGCREDQDRILSLLGIMNRRQKWSSPYPFFKQIHHNSSIKEVYTAFSMYQLEYGKTKYSTDCDTYLLAYAAATRGRVELNPPDDNNLPSWVPDWRNPVRFRPINLDEMWFDSNNSECNWNKSDPPDRQEVGCDDDPNPFRPWVSDDCCLTLYGAVIDCIQDTYVFPGPDNVFNFRHLEAQVQHWKLNEYYNEFHQTVAAAVGRTLTDLKIIFSLDDNFLSATPENMTGAMYKGWGPPKLPMWSVHYQDNQLGAAMEGRCVFITRNGWLGATSINALQGDLVVATTRGHVPMVFRRRTDVSRQAEGKLHAAVVGDAYLDEFRIVDQMKSKSCQEIYIV
jgi:hypothetical protein